MSPNLHLQNFKQKKWFVQGISSWTFKGLRANSVDLDKGIMMSGLIWIYAICISTALYFEFLALLGLIARWS